MPHNLRKINKKNQITLTHEAMKELGVKIGEYVVLEPQDNKKRVLIVPMQIRKN